MVLSYVERTNVLYGRSSAASVAREQPQDASTSADPPPTKKLNLFAQYSHSSRTPVSE